MKFSMFIYTSTTINRTIKFSGVRLVHFISHSHMAAWIFPDDKILLTGQLSMHVLMFFLSYG